MRSGVAEGLLGKYYVMADEMENIPSLAEPDMVRVDKELDFVWYEPPIKDKDSMDFMAEWWGYLKIENEGYYILFLKCDDGCTLELDGNKLIDGWEMQPPTIYQSNPIYFNVGLYEVVIRYFNVGPFGLIKFGWVTPSGVLETVPSRNLMTRSGSTIIIKGLPTGTKIELWSGRPLSRGIVDEMGLAFLNPPGKMPVDGYFKIYIDDEVIESPVIRDLWGGDVFEVRCIDLITTEKGAVSTTA